MFRTRGMATRLWWLEIVPTSGEEGMTRMGHAMSFFVSTQVSVSFSKTFNNSYTASDKMSNGSKDVALINLFFITL